VGFRGALTILLAAGLSSCTCAPAPELEQAVARGPGLRGRVVLTARNADGTSPAMEVRIVPEAAMMEFVSARLLEARSALGRSSAARARARQEATDALAAADRTSQDWKATNDNDLYRRVEVQLRRPSDPREVTAVHDELLARKKAAYARATEAARRSEESERAFQDLERGVRQFREARYYAQGLAPVIGSTRTDSAGSFEIALAPGRFALVVVAEPSLGGGAPAAGWLLWIVVPEGAPVPVVLDGSNMHGTDCEACIVNVKELP
jgi:hypothetical protein